MNYEAKLTSVAIVGPLYFFCDVSGGPPPTWQVKGNTKQHAFLTSDVSAPFVLWPWQTMQIIRVWNIFSHNDDESLKKNAKIIFLHFYSVL